MFTINWGPHAVDFSRDAAQDFLRDSGHSIYGEVEYHTLTPKHRRKLVGIAEVEIRSANTETADAVFASVIQRYHAQEASSNLGMAGREIRKATEALETLLASFREPQ